MSVSHERRASEPTIDASPDGLLGGFEPLDLLGRATSELSDVDETGQRVLDGARALFAFEGLRGTTMEQVAKSAGIGRATVYRKFATKDALVEAVLLSELRDYLRELDIITEQVEGFEEQVVEGFVATLRYVREDSLIASTIAQDGAWGLAYATTMAGPVIFAAREYLASKIRAAQHRGLAAEVDAVPLAELIVRVCHSLMLTPEGVIPREDDEAARTFARTMLVPIITRR